MKHAPFAHPAVALARLQTWPQVPQLFASFDPFVSQPALVSQSRKPGLQAPGAQEPPVQSAPALAKLQVLPQVPQFPTLPLRSASQPSARVPLQLPNPGLQPPIAQVPAVQAGAALAKEQAFPQVPQLVTEVAVLISQPFALVLSQLEKPALQVVTVHVPLLQAAAAFGSVQLVPLVFDGCWQAPALHVSVVH